MKTVTRFSAPTQKTRPADGEMVAADLALKAIVSGSFNPIHRGHLEMARFASANFLGEGQQVSFELSQSNADKATLTNEQLAERVGQDFGGFDLIVTSAATFADKARLTRDAMFVVGADTILRIDDVRFYEDKTHRQAELDVISQRNCRFIVFGRRVDETFLAAELISLSSELRQLCTFVAEHDFSIDISSTSLRDRPS